MTAETGSSRCVETMRVAPSVKEAVHARPYGGADGEIVTGGACELGDHERLPHGGVGGGP